MLMNCLMKFHLINKGTNCNDKKNFVFDFAFNSDLHKFN